jgi:hypothetical protein
VATADKKKPVTSFGPYYSSGSYIEVAVWQNEIAANGRTLSVFAVSFSRNYRADDKWKKTTSLRVQDIPVLGYALAKAQAFILEQKLPPQDAAAVAEEDF